MPLSTADMDKPLPLGPIGSVDYGTLPNGMRRVSFIAKKIILWIFERFVNDRAIFTTLTFE